MKMSRLEINVTKDNLLIEEGTSKGNQDKWYKDGLWIKANGLGYEDIAECLVSDLLKCSNLTSEEFVDYNLCAIITEDKTLDGCYSKSFLKDGESILTINKFMRNLMLMTNKIGHGMNSKDAFNYVCDSVKQFTNLEFKTYLANMFLMDAIILNEDRHLSNIAIIYNSDNSFRLCPIFDNGLSLLSDTSEYRYETPLLINMRNVKSRPFSNKFDKQIFDEFITLRFHKSRVEEMLKRYEKLEPRAVRIIQSSMKKYNKYFIEDSELSKLSSFR